jgi:hypothetical protein
MKNPPCVYFIYDIANQSIKIGYTSLPLHERLSNLQVGNSNILTIKHFINCQTVGQCVLMERMYHNHFDDLKINGEWFEYHESRFSEVFSKEILFESKQKREALTSDTLFGKQKIVSIESHPFCFFYENEGLVAQILTSYEDSVKLSLPFRTMEYPTNGERKLLPYSEEVNRVFISTKKHNQNLELKRYVESKQGSKLPI